VSVPWWSCWSATWSWPPPISRSTPGPPAPEQPSPYRQLWSPCFGVEEHRSPYLDLNIRTFAGDPSVDQRLWRTASPERGGRGRWRVGLAAGARSAPGIGRPGYLHLGARHELPQRQPAGGMAEVDPDQEAACGASASPSTGKTDKTLQLAGPSPS
jgi:hypothetical protein